MNARHAGVLAVVALVAIVAALWTTRLREPAVDEVLGTPVLPGLEAGVNEVSAVHLYTGAESPAVSLERDADDWRVVQKSGYRADAARVRELLLALARAEVLEPKTANAQYYDRLGVGDPGAGGGGIRVEIDGVETAALIVGNAEHARNATYVRRADEAESWLVNAVIEPDADAVQWLDREVVDLPRERVAEVEVVHPDGQRLLASKSEFGQANYEVAGLPEGRQLSRPGAADPLAGALAGLRFDDVVAEAEFEFPAAAVVTTWRTYDGLAVEARLAEAQDQYHARFRARADDEIAQRFQRAATSPDEGDDAAAEEDPTVMRGADAAASAPDMAAAEEEAAALNERWDGWVYRVPKYKYDTLTQELEELLAPLPES